MGEITLGQLQIKCRFKFITILSYTIHAKYGEHTKVSIKAVVRSGDAETELLNSADEKIVISCRQSSNTASLEVYEVLFTGIIEEAELRKEGGETTLYLKAVSYSWKLDIERKSRSFQDLSLSYREVVETVLSEYGGSLSWGSSDEKLSFPLIQYYETDFIFIKRVLSHLKSDALVLDLTDQVRITAGLIDGSDKGRLDLNQYRHMMIPFHLYQKNKWRGEWQQGYEIEDIGFYQIGDKLQIQGKYFWVMESYTHSEESVLRSVCKVYPIQCFQVKKIMAETLKGAVINGTVLDTKKDMIKIHLDIDKEQRSEIAYEFPWEPITGNLLYCMPEKGTRAALYFDKKGVEAAATLSIRENGENCVETADFNNRYFTTDNGKRLYLKPCEIGLVNMINQNAEIKMADHSILQVKSSNQISVLAEGQIELKGNNVMIIAPKETTLIRKDIMSPTVINLCNAFDAIGKKGNFAASPQIVEKKRKKSTPGKEKEKYSLDGVVGAVFANIPSNGLESSICAVIEGSMPFINEN